LAKDRKRTRNEVVEGPIQPQYIIAQDRLLKVLGSDLPMDVAMLVDILDCQNKLSHVEPSDRQREDLILDEHSHQVASWQEFHQHVKEGVILEGRVQFDHPGTISLSQYITLCANVC